MLVTRIGEKRKGHRKEARQEKPGILLIVSPSGFSGKKVTVSSAVDRQEEVEESSELPSAAVALLVGRFCWSPKFV